MNLLFFLLVFSLAGFLLAIVNSYIFIYTVIKYRDEWIGNMIRMLRDQNFFLEIVKTMDVKQQIEELADEKLDHLVANFKSKVPMVGMFLGGELESTLKELAKEELLSMIPDIEKNSIGKMQKNCFYESIGKKLAYLNYNKLLPYLIRLQAPSLLVTTILGAIFGYIFYIFFRP